MSHAATEIGGLKIIMERLNKATIQLAYKS